MATAIATKKLTTELKQTMIIHDPGDATTAVVVGWVPMKNFEYFLAALMFISGTGLLTFKIQVATDSGGSGATTVIAHTAPTGADAAGDTLFLECSVEQMIEVLANATHVGVEVDMDSAGDIAALTYTRGGAKRKYLGLTSDVVA